MIGFEFYWGARCRGAATCEISTIKPATAQGTIDGGNGSRGSVADTTGSQEARYMISKVGTVSVFVQDQKRAKAFYTDILRMELRTDAELFPGSNARWIAVAPSGAETEIILYLPDEGWSQYAGVVGKPQNVTLAVTDLDAVFGDLHAKGVEFTQEPETMPWGTYAMMVDSEGNQLLLVQSPDED